MKIQNFCGQKLNVGFRIFSWVFVRLSYSVLWLLYLKYTAPRYSPDTRGGGFHIPFHSESSIPFTEETPERVSNKRSIRTSLQMIQAKSLSVLVKSRTRHIGQLSALFLCRHICKTSSAPALVTSVVGVAPNAERPILEG